MTEQPIPHDAINKADFSVNVKRQGTSEKQKFVPGVFELAIFHDIRSVMRIAKMTIIDRAGIRELMPLTGDEIFTIKWKNQSKDSEPIEIQFETMTSNEEILDSWSSNNRGITLYLAEYPIFGALMKQQCKGFNDVSSKDIVLSFLQEIQNGGYELDLEDTPDTHYNQFVAPRGWPIVKTLKYICQNTQSGPHFIYPVSQYNSLSMTNKNYMKFKSLKSLVKKEPDFGLRQIGQTDVSKGVSSYDIISDYRPMVSDKTVMLISLTTTKATYYNYETGTIDETIVKYSDLKNSPGSFLSKKSLLRFDHEDRFPVYENHGAVQLDEGEPRQMKKKLQNEFLEDLQTQSQLRLLCPGHELRNVGDIVVLAFPSNSDSPDDLFDLSISGSWLVTEVEHHISSTGTYDNQITVERNSCVDTHNQTLVSVK